jgi:hypothetical protein
MAESPNPQCVARRSLPCFIVVFLLAAGCSSVRKVDIDSKPPNATIYVNGEKKGVTRSEISVDFSKVERVLIQIVKHRYKPILQYWTLDEVPSTKRVFDLELD